MPIKTDVMLKIQRDGIVERFSCRKERQG